MSKSRQDRLAERVSESVAESYLRMKDRRYWALYRTLDMTQTEVKDTVWSTVDTSQSTISRVINDGDTRVLTEDNYIELGGGFTEREVRDEYHPKEWFEAYRDAVARAVTDHVALRLVAEDERKTPEWAARRFPELVGCSHHVAEHIGTTVPEHARDDHLNRLESVNTDRWR